MDSLYTPSQQLVMALKAKNFDEAQRLIDEEGADINERNVRGETPAFMFASSMYLDRLSFIVENGADLDIANKNGDTPLMSAVSRGDPLAVDFLLTSGSDVDKLNKRKISTVMQAVLNENDNGILDRLLEANPNVDVSTSSSTTPLLAAAAHGKIEHVEKLLDYGANPEASDYLGQGLLHAAILSFKPEVLAKVIEKAPLLDPNYAARSGTTAMAKTLGVPSMTSMLLDIGGDPNALGSNRINNGCSLLMSVVGKSSNTLPMKEQDDVDSPHGFVSDELVDKMIDKGADVNIRDDLGRNCAVFTIYSGAVQLLPKLIAAGVDPKRPLDASSTLPYDVLASSSIDHSNDRALELIEEFHSLGFSFDRPQWDESIDGLWTSSMSNKVEPKIPVVHAYLASGFWEGMKKVISLGANVNVKGQDDNSVAHILVSSGFDGMSASTKKALALAKRAKNINEETKEEQLKEITDAANAVLAEVREFFNSENLDWNAQNESGDTALHVAAKLGNYEWTKYLMMDAGVDLTIRNKEGLTAAGSALKAGEPALFYTICEIAKTNNVDLSSGVILDTVQASGDDFRHRQPWLRAVAALNLSDEINEVNEEGQSPLYIASATDQIDVVRALIKMGANPDQQDNAGNTPIMQAVFNESSEVIRLLRAGGARPSIKNGQGQNAFDVANYVKSIYVHKALDDNDLGELVGDLAVTPLTDKQKEFQEIHNIQLQNIVRSWKKEPLLDVPKMKEEEVKIDEADADVDVNVQLSNKPDESLEDTASSLEAKSKNKGP